MAGEKYLVAAVENPFQINIRNILNPSGFIFLGNCSDAISLMRLIRSNHPDFVVIDASLQPVELRNVLETVDDEMLCACVLVGDRRDSSITSLLEKSKVISFCQKPLNREILLQTAEMANMNFKRISELDRKLKDMTENYETRKSVERAKWILMERENLSEKDAYNRIRKKSMDNRMSMKEIADAIILTHEITK